MQTEPNDFVQPASALIGQWSKGWALFDAVDRNIPATRV